MQILHIVASLDPDTGGVAQAVRSLIDGMREMDVINEVVCLDDPGSGYLQSDPFTVLALGTGKGPWNYNDQLLSWLLSNWQNYDAVIVHGLWLYPSHAAEKAHRILSTKSKDVASYFVFTHGMLDPWFQSWKRRPVKTLRNIIYWHLIERKVINGAKSLLFTCEEEKLLATTTFMGYRPQCEEVVGLGIEPPEDAPERQIEAFFEHLTHLRDQPFLLFLSRIHPKKGVDLLLHAYAQLRQEIGTAVGANFPKLVIAGPCADEGYWNELQSLAVSLGLQEKNIPLERLGEPSSCELRPSSSLIWPGMLHGDRKWGALRAADAFILPSHQENFGIAVVEALACETPVLISDKVNIWREIQSGGAGIVEDDLVAGTKRGLDRVMGLTTSDLSKMVLAANATYKKSFSIGVAAEKLRAVLIDSST